MNNSRVSVALCTYNGEKYLEEQLNSLCNQQYMPAEVVIADDHSTDATRSILRKFQSEAPFNVRVILNEQHRGVIRNFESALSACTGDYIALCDQDDVWKPEKLAKLLNLVRLVEMESDHGPYFVHTDLELVDSHLENVGASFLKHQGLRPVTRDHYRTLLVQNYIPGCSALFSRDLLDYALPIPEAAVMHDWWLALIASIAGVVRYDNSRTVLYRQHATNHIGSSSRFSLRTLYMIAAVRPALNMIEKNFTASARQAIAAADRLSSKKIVIPDSVSTYIDALKSSKLRSLGNVLSGKVGRANFMRNVTLLIALILYNKATL